MIKTDNAILTFKSCDGSSEEGRPAHKSEPNEIAILKIASRTANAAPTSIAAKPMGRI
jgi:hypothetical protein